MLTYRKTKNGEWVAYGPADEFPVIRHGKPRISVTLKNGTRKREWLVRLGEPFEVDGTPMRYGYLEGSQAASPAPAQPARSAKSASDRDRDRFNEAARRAGIGWRRSSKCITGGNCSSFGDGSSCGGSDCDGWE